MTFSDILNSIGQIPAKIGGAYNDVFNPKPIMMYAPGKGPKQPQPATVPVVKAEAAPPPQNFTTLTQNVVSPPVVPVSPQPLAAPAFDANTIKSMIALYGGSDAPLNQYADQLAGATRYQFWKDNPELLTLFPFQETSSGRNVTKPNNLTNWGIFGPGNNEVFSQMTKAQVLDRFITGMAERDPNYVKYRTGKSLTDQELIDLGNKYVGSDGKTYGDMTYATNLVNRRADIRQKLGLQR